MPEYIKFNTELSQGQKSEMRRAKNDGCSTTITKKNIVRGPNELMLTETQLSKIKKNEALGKGTRIKISETQMKSQTGGFLGALVALAVPFLIKTILPALGTLGLSAASGAISGATNKATS